MNRGIGSMFTRVASAAALLGCLALASPVRAQAVIKVNDDVKFQFGVLFQGQADWSQNADESYTQNLFLRRARVLIGGSLGKNVTFFFETDSPNMGKAGPTKNLSNGATSTNFFVQDATISWKLANEFILDGGLVLTGIAHNSLQSAASLIPVDYGAYSFLFSGPEQNVVGRDTGFQARGYLASSKLEYRVGVWQGNRDTKSRQAFRTTARVQYNFLDADTGFYYTGTSLGKKKIFAIGAGCDNQKDYKSYAVDAYYDHPLGPGALSGQLDWIRYDGGTFLKSLAKQDVIYGEIAYYISAAKVMPFFTYGNKNIADTSTGDESRWTLGLGYMAIGHNLNLKAAYGRVEPKNGKSLNQFTIQLQAFYF